MATPLDDYMNTAIALLVKQITQLQTDKSSMQATIAIINTQLTDLNTKRLLLISQRTTLGFP